MSPTEYGRTLLSIARASIARALGREDIASDDAPWLHEMGACFVTLTQEGRLRGCIGSIQARRTLLQDLKENAVAAALHDPRFPPMVVQEMEHTQIEVSLLSPMQALTFANEADALAQLRPGVDGLVFEFEHYRSTFLPQVWEQLPDPREFMAHLKNKAGLSHRFWAEGVRLHRYSVRQWTEAGLTVRPADTVTRP
jgi:AmmeMemoRadiSam system protein A